MKGGCQCGHVRFEIKDKLGKASICHCRMCQKAFGNFFAPLVSVISKDVIWSNEPSRFQSSNLVKRGFCSNCGTPLTYEAPDGLAIAIAAFDNPNDIEPQIQFGAEARLKFIDNINHWPLIKTEDDIEDAPFLNEIISYQYKGDDL